MDCAALTGQSVYTMTVFNPIRNIWNRVGDWTRASTTALGISWMSRYIYRYPRLMLLNLSPRSDATQRWPLYLYPPPHFLVGYQYIIRVCNDYIFDSRAFSRLKYTEISVPHQQTVDWSMLSNCSYTINTAAYHRFIDLDNFEETLNQIQQAVLADRIIADLAALRPLQGYGLNRLDNEPNISLEEVLQLRYTNLGECQDEAWGLHERVQAQMSDSNDLEILRSIRKLKTAYFQFLLSRYIPKERELSLPSDCDWLQAFIDEFAAEGDQLFDAFQLSRIPVETLLTMVIDAVCLPNGSPMEPCEALKGGAFELRPREGGLAVTEQMRRRRGEMIERFVDRLPITRRRRRRRPVEEEDATAPSPPPPSFEEEVRLAVAEAIRLLEEELTVAARDHRFFSFAVHFYDTMRRLQQMDDINESTIRRWVMYFFVGEHVATTLNYLHYHFRSVIPFNRFVQLNLAQLVMRARDAHGGVIYSRVWNEHGQDAFVQIMQRVGVDLAATVERAGRGDLDEEEIEQFMEDIAYRDNSGDVQEILRQVELNDIDVDSIELSFRFRFTGPVVFSQNRQIQNINQRVVRWSTQMRMVRRDLPQLNADIRLPPM